MAARRNLAAPGRATSERAAQWGGVGVLWRIAGRVLACTRVRSMYGAWLDLHLHLLMRC